MKGDHTTIINQESDMYREECWGKEGKPVIAPLVVLSVDEVSLFIRNVVNLVGDIGDTRCGLRVQL